MVKRPTDLKLHEFPDSSFIHGCYIRESICDDLISFYNLNPDRHNKGKLHGTCEEHKGSLVSNESRKKSTDINFKPIQNVEDALFLNSYVFDLNKCVSEYEYKYKRAHYLQSYGVNEEGINLQHYQPRQGFYEWHCERDGVSTQRRCLAFMTYLNTVPAGGTEFMYQKLIVPAVKGLTIIWPSDWTHTHRGQISKEHEKFILTGWFNYNT